ncbi:MULTISPECIES: DUF397 domain-containing protein [unclassified Streptomyces]|uniref:DUF397 domain-containing protein n=1 Tax=unclassified Streptomyces TaxID=2593676 RepID=UPI002E2CD8A9|nr:DUF397 domain-containing protein [Streptomyces sp. NBC_01423]WSX91079.1 DUF397 domain-containing protein [Streptomyces sp. NBC_00891]WSY05557.1 DUF397 domain-containing protein [Streptomyces sp. NBC_00890]WSZ07181.1 DUF397 domain-containing protein [Streptomyces sp. NBC_00869]WSZ25320.1 DUF397 domain-containing protein [Streptomyces sp. NBC_00870]
MTPYWTRSSYCDSAGPDCVEVALPPGPAATAVRLRDSKAPSLPALAFDPAAWSRFVGSVGRPAFFSSSS